MGVADNKTYRDMYHFKGNKPWSSDDLPSLNLDGKVNTTIKDNEERANVEIEKGEIVLQNDLSALFLALGKTHKQGGVDVYLKPDSFVFSNAKGLTFTKKDHELFELKYGGNYTKKCTPAEVLKKNVDMEHYNRLVQNLDDVNKDDLSKKSSALMLEKYIGTLGNIAYVQEQKKHFPDGLPYFSQGTAPVYAPGLKENVDAQKQYVRYGGRIMAVGGYPSAGEDLDCPCGRLPNGDCVPNCPDEAYKNIMKNKARKVAQAPAGYNPLYEDPEGKLYGKFDKSRRAIQTAGPKMTNQAWKNFLANETPEHRAKRLTKNQMVTNEDYAYIPNEPDIPFTVGTTPPPQQPAPPAVAPPLLPNSPQGPSMTGKRADWQFTPWQRISQGWNAAKYADLKRYMPMRSQYTASYVDPALLNPEQTVGDMRTAANAQIQSLNTVSPILRNAQAAGAYGKYMEQIPTVRSQYDNQNIDIVNRYRLYNNQNRNQESLTNMKNDQDYYKETVIGRQNFDNMKTYMGDQWMNNVLRDVEANQTLSYNLMTQNNPAFGFDFRNESLTRNKKDIRDVPTDSKSDFYTQMAQSISEKISRGETPSKAEVDFFKSLSVGKIPFTPGIKKRGGMIGNPYKK